MISVYVRQNGETASSTRVEPAWLDPGSPATVWVDLAAPSDEELRLLDEVFHFHPLSLEDARSALQYPKVEPYPHYLYVVLHGIDVRAGGEFATHDVDFFLGRNFLVTVHGGISRSVSAMRELCERHSRVLEEGPVALLHRIVDRMVENYRPAVDSLEERVARLEAEAFGGHEHVVRHVRKLKREIAGMRRVLVPQRDTVGRLARREFAWVSDEMAFRFRDVFDQLTRYAEEAFLFQDRVTGILEVHLASVSNRLNQVMKVLTVISTIFLPLTALTGLWGMNVPMPVLPGGDAAQFWWVVAAMAAISLAMLAAFRRNHWI